MEKLKMLIARYGDIKLAQRDAAKLRGFFAGLQREEALLHNHQSEQVVYRYPLVQYKILYNNPYVIAVAEGIPVIYKQLMAVDTLVIGERSYPADNLEIKLETHRCGAVQELLRYRFVTPWLCLNQENYKTYQKGSAEERLLLLKRIMIGNILSMTKGLGISVEQELQVALQLSSKQVNFKNERMLVFTGEFAVNYELPDHLGLGKSVSRGFGCIRRMRVNKEASE